MIYQGKAIGVEALGDGIAELRFDLAGESVNKFNRLTLGELREAVDALRSEAGLRAVLVSSAKDGFIVGADDPAAEHHHRPAFKLLGGPSDWVGLAGRGAALHSSDALRELSAAVLEWLRERLPASTPLPPADDEP